MILRYFTNLLLIRRNQHDTMAHLYDQCEHGRQKLHIKGILIGFHIAHYANSTCTFCRKITCNSIRAIAQFFDSLQYTRACHRGYILAPIQHGIFWFNGFRPLEPFIAWSAARISDAERTAYLDQLRTRLESIFEERPLELPPLADFPQFGRDIKKRFKVVIRRKAQPDQAYLAKVPQEKARVAELRRAGFILEDVFSVPEAESWRGFLTVRAESEDEVKAQLNTLPLAYNLDFEIYEIA